MKKNFDLWGHSNPPLRKLITQLKIALFIFVVSVSNVIANPNFSGASPIASEKGLQQAAVSGTVTDASTGEALPGVNVVVQGTTVGAITDANGKYAFPSVDRNAVLVFSFIGYVKQEITVAGKAVIDVSLNSESKELSEVVVIGYGTAKKQTLTGSIASIQSDAILSSKTTSVASRIQGKIPGLQIRQRTAEPGTYSSMISIRGFGTPLLVLDGVVRDGMSDFEKLNPEDVESISILKDGSAAIYGMNADNGVIIVTTKKGVKGKTKFSYSGNFTLKEPTTTDRTNSVTAYQHRVLRNEMDKNTGNALTFTQSELDKWKDGTIIGYQDYNWYKICLKNNTTSQQHNFSATGGNDNITFYSSFGYMDDYGLLVNNASQYYKKYSFRTTLEAKLAEGLTAKFSFSGRFDDSKTPIGTYFWLYKRIIVADRGVGINSIRDGQLVPGHYSSVPAENVNPYADMTLDISGYDSFTRALQYQTTVDINYDLPFIKGLSLGVLAAYDGSITNRKSLSFGRRLYTYLTDTPGSLSLSTFTERITQYTRKDIQARMSYKNTFAQAHTFGATLVYEIRSTLSDYVNGRRQWDDVFTHPQLDQGSLTGQTTGGVIEETANLSFIGRFNYDYKNKYLLEFSFRDDGSYRYAPSKRWGLFPAISVGWRAGEEAFIKNNLPIISNLKFRLSYGKMGADAGNPFQYFPGYTFTSVNGGYTFNDNVLTLGMIPPGVVNSNLSWLNTSTKDFGIDLELWRGKLGFTWDLFQKDRTGILATRSSAVPNTFGANFPQENLDKDRVKGFEVELSHRNKIGNVTYSASANMTYSRSYTIYTTRSAFTNTMAMWNSSSTDGRIQGRSQGYIYDGIYTNVTQYETAPFIGGQLGNSKNLPGMTRIVDVNGDGRISGSDQDYIFWAGQGTNPPLQYGINMNVSWKGFDFSALLQGSSMFTIYNVNSDIWGYGRLPTTWARFLDRWHMADPNAEPHDPATVWIPGRWEALTTNNSGTTLGNITSQWRQDATYLRVKSVELGYTIPTNVTRKIKIDNIRLYVNVFNLYTFCRPDVRMFDPERDEGEYQADLTYPLLRQFNFGFNINF